MTNRERFLTLLRDQKPCPMVLVHFGYWQELLFQWAEEGHISRELAETWTDGNTACYELTRRLGFDFMYNGNVAMDHFLAPPLEPRIIAEFPDGSRHIRNGCGVIELDIPGSQSIRAELDHLLKDRASWESEFKPRLTWHADRVRKRSHTRLPDGTPVKQENFMAEFLAWRGECDSPIIMYVGGVIGYVRNLLGIVGLSYMQLDDPELLSEIISTIADLAYRGAEIQLRLGIKPDVIHFWEDICYNHGPLVQPEYLREQALPHYQHMTALARRHGVELVSVDCDGKVDELIPLWLEGGVNTLFPIEMGTWNPDFLAWRRKYGRELRGIGGMNKHVLSQDRRAVDREIERLRPWVEGGGFIPCPDHRLPPDTQWDLVRYYTDRMREVFQ